MSYLLQSSSSSSSSVSPYNVALRHCQARRARHFREGCESETRTPRLNAAGRQRALLCGIGRTTSEAPKARREIVTSR